MCSRVFGLSLFRISIARLCLLAAFYKKRRNEFRSIVNNDFEMILARLGEYQAFQLGVLVVPAIDIISDNRAEANFTFWKFPATGDVLRVHYGNDA